MEFVSASQAFSKFSKQEELTRLARVGDTAAQDALDAWNPWPCCEGLVAKSSRCPPVDALGTERRTHLGAGAFLAAVGKQNVYTAGRDHVLVARGLDDLEVRWSHADCAYIHVLLAGDTVVSANSRNLVALDAATGQVVAQSKQSAKIRDIRRVSGERAVVVSGSQIRCVDLTPSRFGQMFWSHPIFPNTIVGAGGDRIALIGRGCEVLAVSDGKSVAKSPATFTGLVSAIDDGAAFTGLVKMAELDPMTFDERWGTGRSHDDHRLAFDRRFVVVRFTGEEREQVCIERGSGRICWRRPSHVRYRVAVLPGVLYHAFAERTDEGLQPSVALVDMQTGAVRDERQLPVVPLESEPHVAPCHGGVIVVSHDTLHSFGTG